MASGLTSIGILILAAISAAWTSDLPGDTPSRQPSGPPAAMSDAAVTGPLRYKPTGLSLLRPYRRGRVPVIFIHGLWSGSWSWSPMIEALGDDPALRDRYQFWTFGYTTGDPIPYSAWRLRLALDDARRTFDPGGSDPALDRMVLVGHSMGGLLAKMMVQDSGGRLWRLVSDRPFEALAGDPADRELARRVLFYRPRPEVRRVVFIATPHRGSRIDQGRLGRLGARLVRPEEPLRLAFGRLMARNGPAFFEGPLRTGLPTSIDELMWDSRVLGTLSGLGLTAGVTAHSIIADLHDPPRVGGSDGLVPYDSAHLDGVASEFLVSSGHLCQDHRAVIGEVRRILVEHAGRWRLPVGGVP
jgi:pimeloyl-ACP methyl ester carboxylesterase